MRLELADGRVLDISDINLLTTALESISDENDHAILGDVDYIQTAWTGNDTFLAEYRDRDGYFRSSSEQLELSLVKRLFEGFYNKTSDWKNLTPWELIEDNETVSSGRNSGNFKEDIAEQLKRDALNWGKKKLKRFLKF